MFTRKLLKTFYTVPVLPELASIFVSKYAKHITAEENYREKNIAL